MTTNNTSDVNPLPPSPGSGRPPVTSDLHPITDALLYIEVVGIDGIPEERFGRWSAAEVADLKRMCKKFEPYAPAIADLYDAMLELRNRRKPFSYTKEHLLEWQRQWEAYCQNAEVSDD